jgi:HlyD family secretion protein
VSTNRALLDQVVESIAVAPPTPMPRLQHIAWAGNVLLGGFVVGLGLWSVFAPLESAAIVSGVVEVESSRKTIQHFEGGIIGKILVHDGDRVAAGQLLVQLDDTRARTQLQALRAQFWDAQAREARLIAERDGRDTIAFPASLVVDAQKALAAAQILAGQQKIFETRRQVLQSQMAVIEERRAQVQQEIAGLRAQEQATVKRSAIIREEVAAVKPLVDKGLQARPRLLALEREMAEIDGRRGDIVANISRAHQVIAEAQANVLRLQSDRQNEIAQSLRDTQNQISQLAERIQANADQLSRTEVKAPEDGIVTDLRIHTPGGVVGAGAPLMDLVPREDRLIVNAQLRPEDIDVVRAGLSAEVHLTAYSQRRVPPLRGTVTYVSADHLLDKRTGQPYYAAKIRVDDERVVKLKGIEMVPGMPVYAMIKTGESTVALYTLRPLMDSFNRAFRED